jgi:hypothetical protein
MLPENARNLMATLSYPPWKEEMDWSLLTTIKWEKRVTFHAYVSHSYVATRLRRQDLCGQVSSFPQFNTLPVELQLRVLALCPAHTLFQLMHVSSTLRTEASKLFWAIPNAFFLVEDTWLLGGGYPGLTYMDLPFLHHVQKVEIDYQVGTGEIICPRHDDIVESRQDLITMFWESVTRSLPNARQVVINQNWETSWWWKDAEPVMYPLRMLINARPPSIEVAVVVLERNLLVDISSLDSPIKKWQRSFYQPTADGGLVKVHEHWYNTTILVPAKRFNGPIGEYYRLEYESERSLLRQHSLWPLIIEALDRYHFDDGKNMPFACPLSGCDVYMARPGEWMVHAVESHCIYQSSVDIIAFLPDELRAIAEERLEAFEDMRNKQIQQYNEVRTVFKESGKQSRREVQHRWMEQLKNDAAWDTGKKAKKSRVWEKFWQQMYSRGDYGY